MPEEYPHENYYPYWKDPSLLNIQKIVLKWPHRDGIDPQTLLETLNTVFNRQQTLASKIIGVSC